MVTDPRGLVLELGKGLPPERRARAPGELLGISRFTRAFLQQAFALAEADFAAGNRREHYECCIARTLGPGRTLRGVLCAGLPWTEIDTPADLARAREQVAPRLGILPRQPATGTGKGVPGAENQSASR